MLKTIKILAMIILIVVGQLSYSLPEATYKTIESKNYSNSVVDPFKNYNQNTYRLNMTLDKHFIRPFTVGYLEYTPRPIRLVIDNFYNNLRDFISFGNDILQLKGQDAMHTFMRISINSVFGIAGLIDISSSLGLFRHKNSFGKTLKFWGWTHSSYFILPLFGPSTIRDTLGLAVDVYFNPLWYLVHSYYISISIFALNLVQMRALYLDKDKLLDLSLDPYSTMRDYYLGLSGEIEGMHKFDDSIDDFVRTQINESNDIDSFVLKNISESQ